MFCTMLAKVLLMSLILFQAPVAAVGSKAYIQFFKSEATVQIELVQECTMGICNWQQYDAGCTGLPVG